ncbi:MAG: hypothetical protein PF489_11885 [Salinivirgaceae bacterium]|jgi:hypothetical protein|nr:hypothetical protein [Salinivirgaceae bacterium]
MKMKMKGILSITMMAAVVGFMSCGGPKEAAKKDTGFQEINIPCQENGYSDAEYFRSSGSGKSANMATSKDKAMLNAKTRLAGLINSTIKSVTEQYTNEIDVGDATEFEQSFEQMTRDVVKQKLVEVAVTCEKTGTGSSGQYETYLAIQVLKDHIYNGIDEKISKDKKLQLKYDRMKFKEKFDDEMDKLERENP